MSHLERIEPVWPDTQEPDRFEDLVTRLCQTLECAYRIKPDGTDRVAILSGPPRTSNHGALERWVWRQLEPRFEEQEVIWLHELMHALDALSAQWGKP